ncbi:MAG: MBOAT family protein [Lachnospiraceae bacterium]|nr:MBOAT family protein [Lachnospiraceae bacterium]
MGITTFYFLCFFSAVFILYYIIPKRVQWQFLLLVSLIYFLSFGDARMLLYPLASIAAAYWGAKYIEKEKDPKRKKRGLLFALSCNLGVLIVLKYLNLFVYTYNAIATRVQENAQILTLLRFLIPIGVSFYTLSVLSYIFDVYYGTLPAEKNFFKLLLFGIYFPLMISGPIVRYGEMKKSLFEKHSFNYEQVTRGVQRILWGFFKVLVISERMAVIADTVFRHYEQYPGIYIIVAAVCFSFQLYTNFSGSMDIVLGISQTFGIMLPENFKTPFFSKNIQEFWRRWHITLGAWLKDYLFYPLLRTEFFMNLPKKWKERIGKKPAKKITTFLALFILWFCVGLWHGGAWKYIFGSGLLHWFYIVSGELLEPLFKRIRQTLHITDETKWFSAFRMIRTFCLVTIGFLFFNADSLSAGFKMCGSVLTTWNPQILWDGSLLALGLDWVDWIIAILSLLLLWAASCLQQKKSVREWLAERNIAVRWLILYALLFYVILLGKYGPGYNAAEFIYQGF